MYSVFLQGWIHLEEIDFSIISAFKSQVNPGRNVFYYLHSLQFDGNYTQFVIAFLGNGKLLLLIVALVSLFLSQPDRSLFVLL